MPPAVHLRFADRAAWRAWLARHHAKSPGVWLIFGKGKNATLSQRHAVEEALCFGWIDSQVRSLGDAEYVQRFTPRRTGSPWSAVNKRRVARLLQSRRMMPAGSRAIASAKKDGSWSALDTIEASDGLPAKLVAALKNHARARAAADALPPSQRKLFRYWIDGAKTDATRARRIELAVFMLEEGLKFDIATRVSKLEEAMRARDAARSRRRR